MMKSRKTFLFLIILSFFWLLYGQIGTGDPSFVEDKVTKDGAWCWFADPRAIYYKDLRNRTYVGWVDRSGNIKVASYDYNTRITAQTVLQSKLQKDDHANPALLMRPGGKLMVFWSAHDGRIMYYRTAVLKESVGLWSPTRKVGVNTYNGSYTYANPVQLKNERYKIYLFWRGGRNWPTLSTSIDGVNWSKARTLLTAAERKRPYTKVVSNSVDKIHFAFTDANPAYGLTSIYHMYYKGGKFYKANGKLIGTAKQIPFRFYQLDKVYDAKKTGVRAWIHDIALDSSGRPVLVYATMLSSTEHYYRYARWTGKKWQKNLITEAGGSFATSSGQLWYSGGIVLDHTDPSKVYLSKKEGYQFEIQKWSTSDYGKNWSKVEDITTNSSAKNIRPFTPRGLKEGKELKAIWMKGTYNSYVTYNTSLSTLKKQSANRFPEANFSAYPLSGVAPIEINFNGGGSVDDDGQINKYSWNLRDGTIRNGVSFKHIYKKGGRYFPMLTVTDNNGATGVFIKEINILTRVTISHSAKRYPEEKVLRLSGLLNPALKRKLVVIRARRWNTGYSTVARVRTDSKGKYFYDWKYGTRKGVYYSKALSPAFPGYTSATSRTVATSL